MLRFILVCITVIGFLILFIPVMLAEWIIGKFAPDVKAKSSLRIVQSAFKLILKITGVQITVIGEEHVPEKISRCSILEITAASLTFCSPTPAAPA